MTLAAMATMAAMAAAMAAMAGAAMAVVVAVVAAERRRRPRGGRGDRRRPFSLRGAESLRRARGSLRRWGQHPSFSTSNLCLIMKEKMLCQSLLILKFLSCLEDPAT